jgi:hypothetical protein
MTFKKKVCIHGLVRKLERKTNQADLDISARTTLQKVLGRTVSRDSVVGIATSYGLDKRGVGVRVSVGSRIFSTSSRSALRSIQPLIQWVKGALSRGKAAGE